MDHYEKLYKNLKNRWFLNLKIFNKNEKIDEANLKVILDLIKHEKIKDDKSLSDVVDLYGLSCDMKSEFNSNNKRLYEKNRILIEGNASNFKLIN